MSPIEHLEREISTLERRRNLLFKQKQKDIEAIEEIDQMLEERYAQLEEYERMSDEIMTEIWESSNDCE